MGKKKAAEKTTVKVLSERDIIVQHQKAWKSMNAEELDAEDARLEKEMHSITIEKTADIKDGLSKVFKLYSNADAVLAPSYVRFIEDLEDEEVDKLDFDHIMFIHESIGKYVRWSTFEDAKNITIALTLFQGVNNEIQMSYKLRGQLQLHIQKAKDIKKAEGEEPAMQVVE